jgi:hypothetical protein
MSIAATERVSTTVPTVEKPEIVTAGDLFAIVGPEATPGIVGACFDFGDTFTMTAAEAREVAGAFLRAADAAELVAA